MRLLIPSLAMMCAVALTAMAMEPIKERPPQEPSPEAESFDHDEHIGLKVKCDTCHVQTGSPQVRENACAECHDDGLAETKN